VRTVLASPERSAPGIWHSGCQRPAWLAHLGRRTHNALQLLLVLGSLLALVVLLNALSVGLLGYPDLRVIGHDSDAHVLHWYADRFAGQSSSVQLLSMPLWVYRLLMLAWALWLALTLLGVLRWAWVHFSEGGVWRAGGRALSPPSSPAARSGTGCAPVACCGAARRCPGRNARPAARRWAGAG